MCGRYTLVEKDFGAIADELGARYEQELAAAHAPHFNVAPTQVLPVARLEDDVTWLRGMKWGLPGARLQINLRAEGLARPDVRALVEHGRAVVPADGFYEWIKKGSSKRPIRFHRPDGARFYLAGLWQEDQEGKAGYAVITTRPNQLVRPVHDRMPVVLDVEDAHAWLRRGDRQLLAPAPESFLVATPVSSRVNDVKNDDAGCLGPAEAPRQLGLL